jgi:hypothetical protein
MNTPDLGALRGLSLRLSGTLHGADRRVTLACIAGPPPSLTLGHPLGRRSASEPP